MYYVQMYYGEALVASVPLHCAAAMARDKFKSLMFPARSLNLAHEKYRNTPLTQVTQEMMCWAEKNPSSLYIKWRKGRVKDCL